MALYEFLQGDAFKKLSNENNKRSFLIMERDPMIVACKSVDFAAAKDKEDEETELFPWERKSIHTRKPVDPAKRRKDTFKSPERHNSRIRKAKGKPRRDYGETYYNRQYHMEKEVEIFHNAVEDFYNDNDEFKAEKQKTASFAEQKAEIEQLQRQTMDLNKKIRYLEWKRDQLLNRYAEVFQEAYGEMPDNLWHYAEV